MLILYSIFAILATFIGAQIQLSEFSLLTGRINYRAQWPQTMTFVATVLAFIIIAYDIIVIQFNTYVIVEAMLGIIICLFSEWLLSRLSPTALWVSVVWHRTKDRRNISLAAFSRYGSLHAQQPIWYCS